MVCHRLSAATPLDGRHGGSALASAALVYGMFETFVPIGHVGAESSLNPLTGTLKPHINQPLYSNTVIGTLAVDGRLLHLVQRGAWAGCGPAKSPPRCTKCISPPTASVSTSYYLMWHYNYLRTLKG